MIGLPDSLIAAAAPKVHDVPESDDAAEIRVLLDNGGNDGMRLGRIPFARDIGDRFDFWMLREGVLHALHHPTVRPGSRLTLQNGHLQARHRRRSDQAGDISDQCRIVYCRTITERTGAPEIRATAKLSPIAYMNCPCLVKRRNTNPRKAISAKNRMGIGAPQTKPPPIQSMTLAVDIRQSGTSFVLRPGRGSLYHANEPYELHSEVESRQFWIELPRAAFDRRFDSGCPPQLGNFDLTRGLGRIAADFCATLAIESGGLDEASRSKLGEQFMDLIALALNSEPDRQSTDEQSIQRVRLRSVKSYIEANLGDPNLSLTMIARKNGISLRYLHHLFRLVDMSDSEWLRAPAIAKMPRPFDRAAARAPIDHGNRLLYGVQQFFPFQQSFSRLLRHTAFGCKGSGWRTEGTVKLEAIPTTVGRVNPKVCSGSRKSPLSFGLEFRFRSTATQTFFEPATSPLGGKRDYGSRLKKDRNASQSCRSIASTK